MEGVHSNTSDPLAWATLATVALTAGALIFAAYQSVLTRRALESTNRSLALTLKSMQIEILPRFGWAISVQVQLESWMRDLERTHAELLGAAQSMDDVGLLNLAKAGLGSPAGLVRRRSYERAPEWMQVIWMAGAQYYYGAKSQQSSLAIEKDDAFRRKFAVVLAAHFEESLRGLRDLRQMLDDAVPGAILHSPARIDDEDFFDTPG